MSRAPAFIACERITPILVEEMEAYGYSSVQLADEAGIDERHLRRIMTGKQKAVTFAMADKLLTNLGRMDAWHLDLADLNETATEASIGK